MSSVPVYVIRRCAPGTVSLKPGEYRPLRRGQGFGDLAHCIVCCPTCRVSTLTTRSGFQVSFEGVVDPAIVCPNNCGFRGVLSLADWVPEARGVA